MTEVWVLILWPCPPGCALWSCVLISANLGLLTCSVGTTVVLLPFLGDFVDEMRYVWEGGGEGFVFTSVLPTSEKRRRTAMSGEAVRML